MRYLPTILLALLAAILSGLALIQLGDDYRNSLYGTPPTPPGKHLFKVEDLNKVRRITLRNTDGGTATFKISGNQWVVESPWKDRADKRFIDALFSFTLGLKVQEVLPRKGLELEKFGLRKGSIRIIMYDKNNEVVCHYLLGRQAAWQVPSDDGKSMLSTHFIRLQERKKRFNIYLCSSKAGNINILFKDDFAKFRDHHPFYYSPLYLDKVVIQNREGEVVVSRKNLRSPWQITKPLQLRVDPKALSNFFINLARLTAIKVDDRADNTLPTAEDNDTHLQQIAIHSLGHKKDFVLRIYPPAKEGDTEVPATVSDRPNTVFHLPITSADPDIISLSQLQIGVNDLRSKTMTHLVGSQLKGIIIRPSKFPSIILTRTKTSQWQILRNSGYEPTNESALANLIMAVTQDKIAKFVTDAATDLTPYGLNHPFLQLDFLKFDHRRSLRLTFGHDKKGEHFYAHIPGKPNIWEVSQETMSKISIYPWQWRSELVWHIPTIDIENIQIKRKNKSQIDLQFAYFANRWKATLTTNGVKKDATADLNPNRASKFLKNLESLKTDRWLGPNHIQAKKLLQSPDLTINIRIKQVDDEGNDAPTVIKSLKISRTPGGMIYFGKLDSIPRPKSMSERNDEASYFLLSRETVEKLSVDLFK